MSPLSQLAEGLIDEADSFASALSEELSGAPALQFQGMPSDGDSHHAYREMGRAGWIGMHWPEEFGGRGLTSLDTVACEERFGYHWLPLSGYLLSVKTIGNALLSYASTDLQRQLLPEVSAGRLMFCQGFSEPDAGSDLASLRTTARLDGDRFIVNGRKIWTSSAGYADWVYLAVRTDAAEARHRGISVLVAPMDTPGIKAFTHPTVGGGELGELQLDEVEIPAEYLVGRLNAGWTVLMGTLDYERVTSEKVGTVMWILDNLAPLVTGQTDRRTLARLRGATAAARLIGRRAAERLSLGLDASADSSMAKLSIAELMQETAAFAVQVIGPQALLELGTGTLYGRIAAFRRAAIATTIAGGAAEIQRSVIARRGLGLLAR